MAEQVFELISGPKVTRGPEGSRAETIWRARGFAQTEGEDAQTAVEEAVLAEAPETYRDWPVIAVESEPDGQDWLVTLTYSVGGGSLAEQTETFTTGRSTSKVTVSLGTQRAYGAGAAVGDNGGLINVTREGVEGVDLVVPDPSESITRTFSPADWTTEYKRTLIELAGRVNEQPFRGWEAGECLFLGASGTRKGNSPIEVTFEFAISVNRDDIELELGGTSVPNIEKAGHEYIWVTWKEAEAGSPPRLVKNPVRAYVEKTYPVADFDRLELD